MRSLYNSAMAVLHNRLLLLSTLTYITTTAFAITIFASAVSTTRHHHHRRLCAGSSVRDVVMVTREEGMVVVEEDEWGNGGRWSPSPEVLSQRRRLGGLGSAPPTCRSKCGRCTPCKPVHVPIQPGMSFPLEYYPEAWRCKCGNKLFMP